MHVVGMDIGTHFRERQAWGCEPSNSDRAPATAEAQPFSPSRLHTAARPRLTHHPTLPGPPAPPAGISPPRHTQGSWPGWVGGCGVWELERNSRRAPSAPLANVKCLQTEKNRPERLFRLEINVTEKCGSQAISAAFSATHYASALKREGTHFWHVFNLLGSE